MNPLHLSFGLEITLPTNETNIVVGPWGYHTDAIIALSLPTGTKVTGLMVGEFTGRWAEGESAPIAMPWTHRTMLSDPNSASRPIELRPLKAAVLPGENGRADTLYLVDKSFEDVREIRINGGQLPGAIAWVESGCLHAAKTIDSYNPDGRHLLIGAGAGNAIRFS